MRRSNVRKPTPGAETRCAAARWRASSVRTPVVSAIEAADSQGTVYHATGHIQAVDVLPSSGGESFSFELTLNVVGEGNAGHFTAHAVEHLTFTPQGDLTSVVEIFAIRCG